MISFGARSEQFSASARSEAQFKSWNALPIPKSSKRDILSIKVRAKRFADGQDLGQYPRRGDEGLEREASEQALGESWALGNETSEEA